MNAELYCASSLCQCDLFVLLFLLFNCDFLIGQTEAAQHDCYCVQRDRIRKKPLVLVQRFGDFKAWDFSVNMVFLTFLSFLFPEICWTKTHFLSQIRVSTKDFLFLDVEYFGDFEFICLYITTESKTLYLESDLFCFCLSLICIF